MKKKLVLFALLIGSLLPVGAAGAVDFSGIEIHGYVSQGYLYSDHNNYMAETEDGTFQFNEMGVSFSADPVDSLHLALQVFSRDLGDVGNNDVVLGYAFGDYRWRDWLGLRAGKIKIDYGLYNETREMDMLHTYVMLPQSVYPEIWRDSFSNINGGSVYGYVPAGKMGKFSYGFQIGAMEFDTDGGFSQYLTPRVHEELNLSDMDSDYAWFANLQWHTPLPGLKLKGSYFTIEGLRGDGDISIVTREGDFFESAVEYEFSRQDGFTLSLEYAWKNVRFSAEYMEDTYEFDVTFEDGSTPPGGGSPKVTSQGWYVSTAYRFTDWFESALTYSEYYPDKDDTNGDSYPPDLDFMAWLKSTTLSTRFDLNEYCLLKLEASYNDGFGGINLAYNDDGELEDNWWLFAAKVTFSF